MPDDIFSVEVINNSNMFIIKNDVTLEEFKNYNNYNELIKLPYFSCGACNFIDKHGNYNFKLSIGFTSFKKHSRIHVKFIKKGSFIFNSIPKGYTIVKTNKNHKVLYGIANDSIKSNNNDKAKTDFKKYIEDNSIEDTYGSKELPKGINIIGWNCVAIGSSHNLFLVNNYLEIHSPDLILLNEVGSYDENSIKIHEKYDIIIHSKNIGLIHKRKYKITKICSNLIDKNTLITKIQKEKEDNSLIIIVVYNPPNKFNVIKNRNIPNIIKFIIEKYKNCSFILYGDLNINRSKFKELIETNLSGVKNINFLYKTGTFEITRSRADISNNIRYSYLDYMISYNIKTLYFDLDKPPGFSDHIALYLVIDEKEFRDIKINKKL